MMIERTPIDYDDDKIRRQTTITFAMITSNNVDNEHVKFLFLFTLPLEREMSVASFLYNARSIRRCLCELEAAHLAGRGTLSMQSHRLAKGTDTLAPSF